MNNKKYNEKDLKSKTKRWQRISFEASKQIHRNKPSKVKTPISFNDLFDLIEKFDIFIDSWEGEKEKRITDIEFKPDLLKIGYIIGPEGGFSINEINSLVSKGALCINLGRNILAQKLLRSQ